MTDGGRDHPARAWPRAAWLAALTLWLPALLPFCCGPLRECDHCVGLYAACLPVVPGVVAPALLGLGGAWFFTVGGVVTLGAFAALCVALRELPRPWATVVQAVVAVAVAAEALGFASLLRA